MKKAIFATAFTLWAGSALAGQTLQDTPLPFGTTCATIDANGTPTCLAVPTPDFHMFAEGPTGEFVIPLSFIPSSGFVDQINSTVNQLSVHMTQFDSELSAIQRQTKINERGVSMAIALSGVGDLSIDEHFAASVNWGTFQGQNSLAAGVAIRAADHVSFNAGISGDLSGGNVGGRAGVRFAW